MPQQRFPGESWESFDAAALFPPPRLHTNKLTKLDKKDLKKVDRDELGEQNPSGEQGEPQDGDTYTDGDPEKGHVDEAFEMEGLDGGTPDERELRADKEEDRRTEQPEPSQDEQEESDAKSDKAQAKPDQAKDDSDASKAEQAEGAEKPIQKEKEDVDEVAEATSKTSEDVHGGDEATKDIEDSPNAADNGQNPDNQGAEAGEGGEEGEGSEGEGQTPSEKNDGQEGDGETAGGGSDEGSQAEATTSHDASVADTEDWESKADQSAFAQKLTEDLAKVDKVRPASSAGGGAAVDYSGESWAPDRLRQIFFKTRELIKKLLSEEDFTQKQTGSSRWWADQLVDEVVSFRHHRISSAKFDRPRENNIVFFVDVSGSVSSLAELFMALMGGAAGLPSVRIIVGSEAHAEYEIVVDKPFKTVENAIAFFRTSVNAHVCDDPTCPSCKGKIRNVGWHRPYEQAFEPGVVAYLREHGLYNATTTCIFFGDMQGVHFNTPELRKLVRTCKCLWLFTDEPGHHTHTYDLPKAIEAKLPIVYNVRNAKAFAKAVRRFQSIRQGLQIVP